ncbi:hypothetical protein C5L30_001986 [Companilactobacillus farciminis]|jgi:hypothetical protein|uniref:Uncharacterized protein n=1 Tax=Companilactobacillus farciminis TaxID=1612 RepID=A0A4R5NBI3_9LACO|nr:hypothetical protein [Companilactobacillus farciminis]ATO45501.1 hypothetical protein LF20184_01435 [Companilactobacillus farciminis KCTC 3681 = DSM 20184]TDG69853.1 hypothetical protein C5L30_001986 [Companilactobacillus farciminis]
MIEFVKTKNKKSFVFDGGTIENSNNVLRGTFIILFANKIIRINKRGEENISYEYTNDLFRKMNMCKTNNISERRNASDLEERLFNMILNGDRLDDEIRKNLRQNYLEVLHVDNSKNNINLIV